MTLPAANVPVATRNSTVSLVTAAAQLLANLDSLQWQNEKAFGRVELFTAADLAEALRQLLIASGRAAVLVWSGDDFTDDVSGTELRGKCEVEFTLLFVSTVLGNPQTALLGDERSPGLFALRDLVLPAVTGGLLAGTTPTYLRKTAGSPFILREEGKGGAVSRSRVAYSLTLQMAGGEIYTQLGYRPMI
jgi:hypothetical protein